MKNNISEQHDKTPLLSKDSKSYEDKKTVAMFTLGCPKVNLNMIPPIPCPA